MAECLMIDFRPHADAVSNILEIVGDEGYSLRSIRLVPSTDPRRQSLKLDLCGLSSRGQALWLERRLRGLGETIDIIHWAVDGSAAGRTAEIRAWHQPCTWG